MTIKIECDRCHRQTLNRDDYLEVHIRSAMKGYVIEHTYHYCSFCYFIFFNAQSIVNNGTYGGSLNGQEKIGHYVPGREDYDPMMKMNNPDVSFW